LDQIKRRVLIYLYYFWTPTTVYNYSEYVQPLIEIIDTKIILRTKEKTLSVVRNTFDITNIELSEDNFLKFAFKGEIYSVQVDDVSLKEVQDAFKSFSFYEEE